MKKLLILFSVVLLITAQACLSQISQDNQKLSSVKPKTANQAIVPRSIESQQETQQPLSPLLETQPQSEDSAAAATTQSEPQPQPVAEQPKDLAPPQEPAKVAETEKADAPKKKEAGPQSHTVAKPQFEDTFADAGTLEEMEQGIRDYTTPSRDAARDSFDLPDTLGDEGNFATPNQNSLPTLGRRGNDTYSKLVENTIEINTARIQPEKTVFVSAGIAGILTRLSVQRLDPRTKEPMFDADGKPIMIEVEEGQEVYADQEIGTIDDSVELNRVEAAKALLGVARAESEKKIEIEYAEAARQVARALVEKNHLMNLKIPNTVSDQNVREARLQLYQAMKQKEKAEYDLNTIKPAEENVKVQELAIAEATLGQRRLLSPVNGIVDKIVKHKGEWFREGDQILRITQFETLRAVGRVNIHHASPMMLANRPVTVVVPALPHQPSYTLQGKIVYIDQTIQADDHFDIYVRVQNEKVNGFWRINPGLYVDLKIPLN